MILKIERSFSKDIGRIQNVKILEQVRDSINELENSESLATIKNIKKIKSPNNYYRIRTGDYRIGIQQVQNNKIRLIRFLHRKDIYKYFPPK